MHEIGAIPIFVAVVEKGGFTAAADRLGISKSAVSKRITQLEARLGVQLLFRSTRRISLTEAGERYFEHAVEAFAAAKEAEDAVAQLQGAPRGRLRLNAPMSFGRLHIASLIPEFLKRFPEIKIDIVLDDRVVDLVDGGFDIAIRVAVLRDSAMIARKLAPCHNVLVAAPDYIAKHGEPQGPADLLNHNCLHHPYLAGPHEWTFSGPGEPITVETAGNYQVNNSEALLEAVIGGSGIGRLPTFIAGPAIGSGRLVRLLEQYSMPSQTIYAVFPERRHLPAKVRVFVDFTIEKFGADNPYWDRHI